MNNVKISTKREIKVNTKKILELKNITTEPIIHKNIKQQTRLSRRNNQKPRRQVI